MKKKFTRAMIVLIVAFTVFTLLIGTYKLSQSEVIAAGNFIGNFFGR